MKIRLVVHTPRVHRGTALGWNKRRVLAIHSNFRQYLELNKSELEEHHEQTGLRSYPELFEVEISTSSTAV